jgi:hypothetical protein
MFPGCLDPVTGCVRVKLLPPPPDASWNHGLAFGPDFVYAELAGTPIVPKFVNGLPANADGRLIIAGGSTVAWANGLPFNPDSHIHRQTAAPTHWVNGLPMNGERLAVEVVP